MNPSPEAAHQQEVRQKCKTKAVCLVTGTFLVIYRQRTSEHCAKWLPSGRISGVCSPGGCSWVTRLRLTKGNWEGLQHVIDGVEYRTGFSATQGAGQEMSGERGGWAPKGPQDAWQDRVQDQRRRVSRKWDLLEQNK